jgi:hypothetical protein
MYLTRHSDMLGGIDMNTPIHIIGAGSIGSYATLALTKLGFNNIYVADDGIVEEENIAPQFYKTRDIGKFKVDCLKRSIKELTNTEIITIPSRITYEDYKKHFGLDTYSEAKQVLILAVDSMSARKDLRRCGGNIVVDARMAIEFLTIISYKYTSDNYNKYATTLFDDSNAVQEACTNKAISYTSLIAGGLIAKTVMDRVKGEDRFITVNFDINSTDLVRLQ